MDVKLKKENDIVTAMIYGDIDHHNAKEIRETIDVYVEKEHPKVLNLDFSKVEFMDSSGIGLIMGRYRIMQMLNGSVKVINIPDNIKRIIKLSGLLGLGVIEEGAIETYEAIKE